MKKHVFRPGDKVRIKVGARPVRRVGYPLDARDLELTEDEQEFVNKFRESKYKDRLDFAIRSCRVHDQNFGGNERSLHYHPLPVSDDACQFPAFVDGESLMETGTITDKCFRKTGKWISRHRDYESGFKEPGCLLGERTVILLHVEASDDFLMADDFWINADDVEPIP